MPVDPGVVASIRALVEADPSNLPLQRHLAELLLDQNEATAAQAHIHTVLSREPANAAALVLAARAADALGDAARAAADRRLSGVVDEPGTDNDTGLGVLFFQFGQNYLVAKYQ